MLVACVNVMQTTMQRCSKNLRASLVNLHPAMIDSYPVHFPAYRTLLPYEDAAKVYRDNILLGGLTLII